MDLEEVRITNQTIFSFLFPYLSKRNSLSFLITFFDRKGVPYLSFSFNPSSFFTLSPLSLSHRQNILLSLAISYLFVIIISNKKLEVCKKKGRSRSVHLYKKRKNEREWMMGESFTLYFRFHISSRETTYHSHTFQGSILLPHSTYDERECRNILTTQVI